MRPCFENIFQILCVEWEVNHTINLTILFFMVVHLLQNLEKSWRKNIFFEKIFVFLQNIHFLQKKMFLHWKKGFVMKKFFLWEKTFFTEKSYISFQKHIFTQKIFVLQIKYESFLNIYSFCKKKIWKFLTIKNTFLKTSFWTQ